MKTKQKLLVIAISLLLTSGCSAHDAKAAPASSEANSVAASQEAVKAETVKAEKATKTAEASDSAKDEPAKKEITKATEDKAAKDATAQKITEETATEITEETTAATAAKTTTKKTTPAVSIANRLNTAVLMAKDSDNTADRLVSGLGIARLLQAIADGAADDSYRQIDDYLGLDDITLAKMQFDRDKALQYADALLITDKKAIDKSYSKNLTDAGFVLEKDLDHLNAAVAKQTQGLIKKALGKLDPNTKMVLVNSLYFKDKWAVPFDAKQTRPQTFKAVCDGKIADKTVPMMRKEDKLALYRDEAAKMQGVALPFAEDYTLVIAMSSEAATPQSADKAAAWLLATDDDKLSTIMTTKPTTVRLTLPKWQLTAETNLIPALRAKGINDIFDVDKANLKKASSTTALFVQKFMQKVVFNADEQGAEAAAVTTAVIATRSATIPETVNIDKPFAFAVVQNDSGLVVLSGKINQLNACNHKEENHEKSNK